MALGWPSVAWGLKNISSYELSEWEAYYQIEPFGEEQADFRAGIIASTIANVNRDDEKKPAPFMPQDFMVVYQYQESLMSEYEDDGEAEEVEESPKWEGMLQKVKVLNMAFHGKDNRL